MTEEICNTKIQLHITEEDYIKFCVFHNKKYGNKERKKIICGAIILVGWALLTVIREWIGLDYGIEGLFLQIIGALIFLSFIFYVLFRILNTEQLIRRNMAELKKRGNLPYESDIQITIEDNRLVQESKKGVLYINKTNISKIFDEPDYYYIYVGAIQAVILPKRYIAEYDGEIRAFLEI